MAIRTKLKKLRYWLVSHHEERCSGCEYPHAHSVSVHCAGCDRVYCPFCVTWIGEEGFCKECEGGTTRWQQRARSGKA